METSVKLLNCPFCGMEPIVWQTSDEWFAACKNEECPMNRIYTRGHKSKAEAKAAWNTRTPAVPALYEALELAIGEIRECQTFGTNSGGPSNG